jgi:Tfp pilus assembly protein PilN
MIRINLALLKRPSGAGASSSSGDGTTTALNAKLRQFGVSASALRWSAGGGEADIRAVGRSVLLTAVVWFALDYTLTTYRDEEVGKLDAELATVQADRDKLQAEVGKRALYEQEKVKLEAEEKLVQVKIDTLDRLSKGRGASAGILDTVSRQIPAEVWLSDLSVQAGGASFQGYSEVGERVTDFMSQLDRSPYFRNAVPKIEVQRDPATGTALTRFDLALERMTLDGE